MLLALALGAGSPARAQGGAAFSQLLEQAGPIEIRPAQPPALRRVADGGRIYALAELAALRSGPDAENARLFLANLRAIGWPAGLFRRLADAGVRIAFYAPDERSADDKYAVYDFRSKTIYLWTNRGDAIAAELAHAVSDLLEPDDPARCTGMMSLADPELFSIWLRYVSQVNRYLGVGAGDGEPRVYAREFAVYMLRREISSPNYWFGGDPILGQQGYYSREGFWEEGVLWYFTGRDALQRRQPALAAFVAKTLARAEAEGFREKVGQTPDMSGCFASRFSGGARLPIAR